MKRIFALLLAFCMLVGLCACGDTSDGKATKPAETTEESRETVPLRTDIADITVGSMTTDKAVPDSNDEYINPEKFGGKELQIYGLSSIVYDDIENMETHNFLWMMRAAADEWATLNNVTLSYEGDYNANAILGAINSGDRPDLLLLNKEIPGVANVGIAKAFTEEEYKAISDIMGTPLLDCMSYKGKSYGFVYPWSGANWFAYNETMFESYGAKTPLEYYQEGNWTWDTMVECFEAVTKDFDGNGKIDNEDTYGCSTLIMMMDLYQSEEKDDGTVVSLVETSKYFRKYAEIAYKGVVETLSLAGPSNQRCHIVTTPRPGCHIGDTEWYNFDQIYRYNELGEVIRKVPLPVFSNDDSQRYTIMTGQTMSMMSSCDEPEATLSLICYMLKVGMRYMSDYSCGLYKCTFEGLRGASEYSKAYLKRQDEVIADRRARFAELEDWDQALYEQMVADVLTAEATIARTYVGKTNLDKSISQMPPASSLPVVAQKQQAWIEKYNSLYAG